MVAWTLSGGSRRRDMWDRADLVELQNQSIVGSALAIGALGCAIFYVATFGLTAIDFHLFEIAAELVALAAGIGVAVRRWARIAAILTVGGLFGIVILNQSAPLGPVLLPWLTLVVFLAVIVLGWPAALGVSLTATVLLTPLLHSFSGALQSDFTWSAIFLTWATVGFSWLIVRPTRIALAWSWESYCRAQDQTNKARERQAELASLSKTLGESYYQLEQLNLELEQARREAQEARHLKAQFAAAVSHELRTPLNLVIGFCEMMVLSPATAYGEHLPTNYQSDIETIYRNACHISELVDDILDLSQIDADRMALHREFIDVDRVVDEGVATVGGLFRERQLYLDTITGDDIPPILADQTRIRQILINLLSNAARFTDEGGVTVRVEMCEDGVVVSVSDTGPGIPPDKIPYVFQEFFQVPNGSPRRGGSGLGLTVSKRFAELHGGTMWVTSEVGKGSTFFLRIPASTTHERNLSDGINWDSRLRTRVHGTPEKRVLVVDSCDQLQRLFRRYLDGYHTVHVPNLPAPHEVARLAPLRAIVLESSDQRGQCIEILQQIPKLRGVPIIVCPHHFGQTSASNLGVTSYLVKPVTREQLRLALRRLHHPVRSALVVDDDSEMALLLSRMLRSIARGCLVEIVTNGRDALQQLRHRRPDVVFLDLVMAGLTGYDVIDTIHGDSALAEIPIVVVSAQNRQGDSLVTTELSISHVDGIPVTNVIRWLKGGLASSLNVDSV